MAYKQRLGKLGPIRMTDPENKIPDSKAYANRSTGEKLVSKSSSITPGGSTPFSGYSTTVSRTYATPGTKGSYTKPTFTPSGDRAYPFLESGILLASIHSLLLSNRRRFCS